MKITRFSGLLIAAALGILLLGVACQKSADQPAAAKQKYTCPMHPEVVQDGPGKCPKCGMALEIKK